MKTWRRLFAGVIAGLAGGLMGGAGTLHAASGPAGHWEGSIDLPQTQLEIHVDLQAIDRDGTWEGSIDIPAQMVRGLRLIELDVEGGQVAFKLPDIPGDPQFAGELDSDGNAISGTFRQSGREFPFSIKRAVAQTRAGETPAHGVAGEGLVGHWQGSLRAGPAELRLVLHVATGEDGALEATLDSIDQGAKGIPGSSVTLQDGVVQVELKRIKAAYEGRMSEDGAEIEGNWKQGPVNAPVVFKRLAAEPEIARPQEPKRPYPYREHEVEFAGGSPDVTLAGTLTMPEGEGPFPAVVLLSGSGPQDRDESLMGHRPFLVLADHLTREGIAVLRFDDRGVARSTGKWGKATYRDFAADGLAAFRFLREQSGIDRERVGLCGHSEGGIHATIGAAEDKDVAFIVMLAGVGVPMDQLLRRQRQDIIAAMGGAHAITPEEESLQQELFAVVRKGGDQQAIRAELRKRIERIAAKYTPEQREHIGLSDAMIEQQVQTISMPWFAALLDYDPAVPLAQVKCPVFALNGEKDLQVAWKENLEGIRRGLEAGGNQKVETRSFPDLNHLFQRCRTGVLAEYGTIEETMNPAVLDAISDWILRQRRVAGPVGDVGTGASGAMAQVNA